MARELTGEEREHWFELGVEIYPGWTHYSRRTDRRIPVLELRPVA